MISVNAPKLESDTFRGIAIPVVQVANKAPQAHKQSVIMHARVI